MACYLRSENRVLLHLKLARGLPKYEKIYMTTKFSADRYKPAKRKLPIVGVTERIDYDVIRTVCDL